MRRKATKAGRLRRQVVRRLVALEREAAALARLVRRIRRKDALPK